MSPQRCRHSDHGAQCELTTEHLSGFCYTHRDDARSTQLELFHPSRQPPGPLSVLTAGGPDAVFDGPARTFDEDLRRRQLCGLWESIALTRALQRSLSLTEAIAAASAALATADRGGDSRRWGRGLQDRLVLTKKLTAAISREAVEWCATSPGAPDLAALTVSATGSERTVSDLTAHAEFADGTTAAYPIDLKVHDHRARDTTAHDLMSLSGVLATATGDPSVLCANVSATDAFMALAKGDLRLDPGADVWALVVARDHSTGDVAEIYVQSAFGAVDADGALGLATNPTRTQSVVMRRARHDIARDADPEHLLVAALSPASHGGRAHAVLLSLLLDAAGPLGAADRRRLAATVQRLGPEQLADRLLRDDEHLELAAA